MTKRTSAIAKPFLWVAIGWLIVGLALSFGLTTRDQACSGIAWMTVLWSLCMVDLGATGKLVASLMGSKTSDTGKRTAYLVQTSVWGVIKVVCLGIFGLILMKDEAYLRRGCSWV